MVEQCVYALSIVGIKMHCGCHVTSFISNTCIDNELVTKFLESNNNLRLVRDDSLLKVSIKALIGIVVSLDCVIEFA